MSEVFFSARFQYTWGPHSPTLHVESGTTLRVVCPDSDNGLADGSQLADERRQRAAGSSHFEGNPLAGPIFVRGATSGDTLSVTIDDIELDRHTGATLLAPNHGLLSRDQLLGARAGDVPAHLYQWSIDPLAGVAEVVNPRGGHCLRVPLRPMVGSIGVCPAWGQAVSSLFAGDFGGNLDLPQICRGTTLLLPVNCDGGLLALGDIHAAQGAGEIVGGGIETSGIITLTIHLVKNQPLVAPRLLTEDNAYAVATHGDLRVAVGTAYARLVDWLAVEGGLERCDAYQLVSQCGDLQLGGIVSNYSTVAAGIALCHLPRQVCQEISKCRVHVGQ